MVVSRRGVLAAAAGAAVLGGPEAAARPPAPADPRPRVDHYGTGPNGELVAAITPVRKAPYRYTTLYSLKLPALRAGDVVQAHAQFEVTNDLGVPVMVAHGMLVHPKRTVVAHAASPPGTFVAEYAGENVTPDMHHGFRTLAGSFAATADGDAWLSVVIYAAGPAPKAGQTLEVERGYGGLRAIVFRNADPGVGDRG
ncbi:MAG TPA: hypothetical protein VM597_07045 [Gemmataceae bacterium]|nr:hypothetical protein [Gemmataceae bacterium]